MTMSENANLIQFLEAVGWTDGQITNLQLVIEGRIPIEDGAKRHEEKGKQTEA